MVPFRVPPSGQDDEPLHVLDLPQLYTRPSFNDFLVILELLKVPPPSWNSSGQLEHRPPRVWDNRNDVAAYLSRIISNGLKWLDSDEQREEIWELASTRLSERSGRTGMPAMTRTWMIPTAVPQTEFALELHEPPLTGDNLGLKTWASSYLLARRLHTIGSEYLGGLLQRRGTVGVLELGSGTGLVGLAAAATWKCPVLLTDLPDILPNLQHNAERNRKLIEQCGGKVSTKLLDWADPQPLQDEAHFEIILAADVIYSSEHAALLVPVIDRLLVHNSQGRVIVELPERDRAASLMKYEFQGLMNSRGFEILQEGRETGFDDWEINGSSAEVHCWWAIWGRASSASPFNDMS